MENLKGYIPFFHLLLTTHKKQKIALLKSASKQQIEALCEVILNIITKTIPITSSEDKFLKRQSRNINKILRKTASVKYKQLMFSKRLKIVDVILSAVLNFLRNDEDSTEVYPDSDREVQKDE